MGVFNAIRVWISKSKNLNLLHIHFTKCNKKKEQKDGQTNRKKGGQTNKKKGGQTNEPGKKNC